MIIVGLETEWENCAGGHSIHKFCFECADIHEAAVAVLKNNWSNGFQGNCFKSGEFHDDSTGNSWSVDSGGHTKRDYRKESTKDFIGRWKREEKA